MEIGRGETRTWWSLCIPVVTSYMYQEFRLSFNAEFFNFRFISVSKTSVVVVRLSAFHSITTRSTSFPIANVHKSFCLTSNPGLPVQLSHLETELGGRPFVSVSFSIKRIDNNRNSRTFGYLLEVFRLTWPDIKHNQRVWRHCLVHLLGYEKAQGSSVPDTDYYLVKCTLV